MLSLICNPLKDECFAIGVAALFLSRCKQTSNENYDSVRSTFTESSPSSRNKKAASQIKLLEDTMFNPVNKNKRRSQEIKNPFEGEASR